MSASMWVSVVGISLTILISVTGLVLQRRVRQRDDAKIMADLVIEIQRKLSAAAESARQLASGRVDRAALAAAGSHGYELTGLVGRARDLLRAGHTCTWWQNLVLARALTELWSPEAARTFWAGVIDPEQPTGMRVHCHLERARFHFNCGGDHLDAGRADYAAALRLVSTTTTDEAFDQAIQLDLDRATAELVAGSHTHAVQAAADACIALRQLNSAWRRARAASALLHFLTDLPPFVDPRPFRSDISATLTARGIDPHTLTPELAWILSPPFQPPNRPLR
ncbi:hypothetical protein [Nocardia huaxiensis]|uniref:hypothetical protein n=1 Tax=Nocardia huaxiensis TaxID=2755382 RepID=UPI001E438890|nr:hypothetical protein [Nocardia huaxiensis]UFS98559.1 hypothetical protein LPY97_11990 [Nocardia huaxiensis]